MEIEKQKQIPLFRRRKGKTHFVFQKGFKKREPRRERKDVRPALSLLEINRE
jgi:hypothetical protein